MFITLMRKHLFVLYILTEFLQDEETLLCANVGPVVVAYTVWSHEKGMGRKIILELQDMIRETYRFKKTCHS